MLLAFIPLFVCSNWVASVTCLNQQNTANVILGQFWTRVWKGPAVSTLVLLGALSSPAGEDMGKDHVERLWKHMEERGQLSPCSPRTSVTLDDPDSICLRTHETPQERPAEEPPSWAQSILWSQKIIWLSCCFKPLSLGVFHYLATDNPNNSAAQMTWDSAHCHWVWHVYNSHKLKGNREWRQVLQRLDLLLCAALSSLRSHKQKTSKI